MKWLITQNKNEPRISKKKKNCEYLQKKKLKITIINNDN